MRRFILGKRLGGAVSFDAASVPFSMSASAAPAPEISTASRTIFAKPAAIWRAPSGERDRSVPKR